MSRKKKHHQNARCEPCLSASEQQSPRREEIHPRISLSYDNDKGKGAFAFGLLLILSLTIRPASADPPACLPGFVNRQAHPGDHTCVTPASKARAQAENAVAPLSWTPGPFGPKTCALGLVWREAFEGDFTCVTPAIRTFVREENLLGPSRRAP